MDTFFADYRIIDNDLCNVYCDQIMANIREHFKEDDPKEDKLNDHFVLSGRLALNLQADEEEPIRNVVFITDSREIFDFHQLNANTISPSNTGVINFKNHTLVNFNELFIEVWFFPDVLSFGKYEQIPVQSIIQIPEDTL